MTSATKRQLRTTAGEFLREAGVLVIVLSPMESLITHGRLTIRGTVATLVTTAYCLSLGFWAGLEDA